MVNVAILGFGVVGSGVAEVLATNGPHIDQKVDDLIRLKYILDVRDFPDSPFAENVVHDFSVIENDPEVSIVVETIGGAKAALDFTRRALRAGNRPIHSVIGAIKPFILVTIIGLILVAFVPPITTFLPSLID